MAINKNTPKAVAEGAAIAKKVVVEDVPQSRIGRIKARYKDFDEVPTPQPPSEVPAVVAAVNEQVPPAQSQYPSSPRYDLSKEESYDLIPYAQAKYLQDVVDSGAAIAEQIVQGTPPTDVVVDPAPVKKQRKERESLFNNPGNAKPGYKYDRITIGPGRSFTPEEMAATGVEIDAYEARLKTAPEVQIESGTAIAEQVMQGTPLKEVVVAMPDEVKTSPSSGMSKELIARRIALDEERRRLGDINRSQGSSPERVARIQQISAELEAGVPSAQTVLSSVTAPQNSASNAAVLLKEAEFDGPAGTTSAGGGMGPPGGGTRKKFTGEPDPDRIPPEAPILKEELEARARLAGKGVLNSLVGGWRAGSGEKTYADSVPGDTIRGRKFPEIEGASGAEKAAFTAGRIGADVIGYGTRKLFWNLNPEDALGTLTKEAATWAGLNSRQGQLARYAGATTLGLVGANYNPFNVGEGGRSVGFSAVNPTEEDARKTDNPIGELLFDRMMLGRTGRLLPWEEFHQERPDVPYEKYARYQDYIRGPSALGMFKATADGIDGPEARIVGYRVQPEAVAAALAAGAGVIAAFKYGGKGR